MKKGYLLYNPLSGTGSRETEFQQLEQTLQLQLTKLDVTAVTDYRSMLEQMTEENVLIIAGGDGTLNRFANNVDGLQLPCRVLYYPCGSGNDFARDVRPEGTEPIDMEQWLKKLPSVEVKGQKYLFLNGVGYGIDGYCCEIGDELRKIPGKKVNYTAIAIRGLLMDYVPANATVTVDGKTQSFRKVWIAPTMLGRFYGGGMNPCPAQDRKQDQLSVMLFHGSGKLRTLMIFPSLFQGKHIKHTKYVTVLTGKEITVEFDQPRPLQIDGETILNVSAYTAKR